MLWSGYANSAANAALFAEQKEGKPFGSKRNHLWSTLYMCSIRHSTLSE